MQTQECQCRLMKTPNELLRPVTEFFSVRIGFKIHRLCFLADVRKKKLHRKFSAFMRELDLNERSRTAPASSPAHQSLSDLKTFSRFSLAA